MGGYHKHLVLKVFIGTKICHMFQVNLKKIFFNHFKSQGNVLRNPFQFFRSQGGQKYVPKPSLVADAGLTLSE